MLAYVLQNARKHRIVATGADPCSSGPWFDGWLGGECGDAAAVERPAWLRAAGRGCSRTDGGDWDLLDLDAWPGAP